MCYCFLRDETRNRRLTVAREASGVGVVQAPVQHSVYRGRWPSKTLESVNIIGA